MNTLLLTKVGFLSYVQVSDGGISADPRIVIHVAVSDFPRHTGH